MDKVYIIIEKYDDYEGHSHYKLCNNYFYTTKAEAEKVANEIKQKALEEDWESVDLIVEELNRA